MQQSHPLTLTYDRAVVVWLERQIRKLCYGDSLTRLGYRLEYIDPPSGFVHYRLYRGAQLVGIQYVRSPSWLPSLQRTLAIYLSILGFARDNSAIRIGGAKTPLRAETNRLPKLFEMPDKQRKIYAGRYTKPTPEAQMARRRLQIVTPAPSSPLFATFPVVNGFPVGTQAQYTKLWNVPQYQVSRWVTAGKLTTVTVAGRRMVKLSQQPPTAQTLQMPSLSTLC